MDEDNMIEDELETSTTITTAIISTTEPELYAIPTKPNKHSSILTKISPTLQSINVLTTTKSVLDGDSFYDDSGFMSYAAPNSKAIRTLAKNPTPPSNRKDYDSNNLFSVLIVFLLFVVIVLICAIISTVYYRY
uniref:Uncharacterized protein n=1 Tax=Panagrolaimus davidi TaxID=227884 RepID=A0A914Q324_9BILA